MFKISKLNSRYNGNTWYGFVATLVTPTSYPEIHTSLIEFDTVRVWCTEVWGTSSELNIQSIKLRRNIPGSVTEWCWMSDFTRNKFRIYLKTSAEVTLFKLKWC